MIQDGSLVFYQTPDLFIFGKLLPDAGCRRILDPCQWRDRCSKYV